MQQSNAANALIPIDENNNMEMIMGDQMMTPNMGNLYEQLTQSIQSMNQKEETKPKKKRAKAKAKATALPAVPDTVQNPAVPAKAQVQNDKEVLIMKILKYQSSRRFGEYITKKLKITQSREQLLKLSVDKLNNILHRIRLNLNNRNMDAIFENVALTCAKGYETTITGIGYNIEGFTDLLVANPGFWDAFERWKIERELPDIPPGIQLGYIVASTTLAAHNLNAHNVVTKESRSNPETKNKDDTIVTDKEEFTLGKNI